MIATETSAATLAELSEHAYGKPVTDTAPPVAEVIAGAYDIHTDGYGGPAEWGVIVHVRRTMVDGGTEDAHKITWCDSARYRDDVLLPFYGFYDATVRIERFGPDIRS